MSLLLRQVLTTDSFANLLCPESVSFVSLFVLRSNTSSITFCLFLSLGFLPWTFLQLHFSTNRSLSALAHSSFFFFSEWSLSKSSFPLHKDYSVTVYIVKVFFKNFGEEGGGFRLDRLCLIYQKLWSPGRHCEFIMTLRGHWKWVRMHYKTSRKKHTIVPFRDMMILWQKNAQFLKCFSNRS